MLQFWTIIRFYPGTTDHQICGEYSTEAEARRHLRPGQVLIDPPIPVHGLIAKALVRFSCEKCDQPYL